MTQKQAKVTVSSNTKGGQRGLKGVSISVGGKGHSKAVLKKVLKDVANEEITTVKAYHILIQ